jgi:curved DNA-binding protein CbpA
MALKFHPDKNSAPGAEDAFKSIGGAFATLSDGDKRAYFDRYGVEEGSGGQQQQQARRRQGGGQHGGMHHGQVDPEDLFNMFFGGGMNGGGMRRQQQQRQQAQPQQAQQQQGGAFQFLQLLPLLMLFGLSFMNTGGDEVNSAFNLQRNGVYKFQRHTQTHHVIQNIPYFVKDTFDHHYGRDYRTLAQVEAIVEQTYERDLTGKCQQERQHQRRMIYNARQTR